LRSHPWGEAEDVSLTHSTPEPEAPSAASALIGYGAALALVTAATTIAVSLEQWIATPHLALVFVLPVVIVAVSFGWRPALLAAVAGVLACNFFLIEPRYTLRVSDPANLWGLFLLLVVAAIVSGVASGARRRALEAQEHADQALALQRMARDMIGAADADAIAAVRTLERIFKAPAVVLKLRGDELSVVAASPGVDLTTADLEAARWALGSRLPTRAGTYPIDAAGFDFWPVITPARRQAVIGVALAQRGKNRPASPERLVEIVGGYLAVALDREAYAAEAVQARLTMEGERVKADLLAAVSHDLKTPLSTILLTLQSLRKFGDGHDPAAREALLAAAEAETARLSGLVANLLDMNRLDADAIVVRPTPVAPADLVAGALARAGGALAGHPVGNMVVADLPALLADEGLAQTALAAVLENAGKYARPGAAITVRAALEGGMGVIEVLDEGPGFSGEVEPLFGKFTRGVDGDGRPPGTGLGLAIARGFLAAQGGRIEAANRTDGPGARVRLFLPLATAPQ
jgi:two-component system sensor histidine kinase KdpD